MISCRLAPRALKLTWKNQNKIWTSNRASKSTVAHSAGGAGGGSSGSGYCRGGAAPVAAVVWRRLWRWGRRRWGVVGLGIWVAGSVGQLAQKRNLPWQTCSTDWRGNLLQHRRCIKDTCRTCWLTYHAIDRKGLNTTDCIEGVRLQVLTAALTPTDTGDTG